MQSAALYIRVSTEDQTEYSPEAQKHALLDYARQNDIYVENHNIFIDEGISGRKAEKRPQFMHMIATAKMKPKPFDMILVHKFDRFARSREDSIVYKSLLRKECNIQVISITERMEDDKFSVILEAMLEAMAEYYSLNLAEEVKKGMTEKARRGEYQTLAPYGYLMKEGALYPDDEKSAIVKKIYHMYLYESKNCFCIARTLNSLGLLTNRGNPFENRTIKYILQNPVYKGYVRWNPEGSADLRKHNYDSEHFIVKKGKHDAIIDENTWQLVSDKLNQEHQPRHAKPNDVQSHWLSGLLFCSDCGSVLVSSGSNRGFQCNAYAKGKCKTSHYVTYKKIEEAILNTMNQLIECNNFHYEIKTTNDIDEKIRLMKDNLNKIIRKKERIKEAYLNGIDTLEEYRKNKEILLKESDEIEQTIRLLQSKSNEKNSPYDMIKQVSGIYNILVSDVDKTMKHEALSSIIDKIIYHKKNEHIDVYFRYS